MILWLQLMANSSASFSLFSNVQWDLSGIDGDSREDDEYVPGE
jgi:hypothetical protein